VIKPLHAVRDLSSHPAAGGCRSASPGGFTLVELLVVLAVIGTLVGMLLPAVLRVRESGRQTQCGNNVHNMALGVLSYASSKRYFPPGCDAVPAGASLPNGTQHAWSSYILPFIEESAISNRIDYKKFWNASGGNDVASDSTVSLYICPSGMVSFNGKADYGGISGTYLAARGQVNPAADPSHNGILTWLDADHRSFITPASASDGLSHTLLIGESVDRGLQDVVDPDMNGRWGRGTNAFPQNAPFVNIFENESIRSRHLRGAQTAFADGRVMFLSDTMDPDVLAAICTRNGGETCASAVNAP